MVFPVRSKTGGAAALRLTALALVLCLGAVPADRASKSRPVTAAAQGSAALWSQPVDVTTWNLFYGSGGKQHEPHGPFTFIKEDMNGSNPKYDVRDADGIKWKVKLGIEARPETTSSRLVWAAGYFVTEDYFLPDIRIDDMPSHVHRGGKLIGPGGLIHNVRLKREPEGWKKTGIWSWRDSQFTGCREWNGLRTLMAVIDNWDLKDENNAVYQAGPKLIYLVTDLGASFGSAGRSWPEYRAKDNLDSYDRARFIRGLTPETVDFATPARPTWVYAVTPREYLRRIHLEYLGKGVPRADARWLGELLARLTPRQIHDAFRAGGYSPQEIDAFSRILEGRIRVLTSL